VFRCAARDDAAHAHLLAEVQRLRGSIYLDDGAILPEELTSDGRHYQEIDGRSWHVLTLNAGGRISGCLRVLDETTAGGFEDLWIRHSAMARSDGWGYRLRQAIETEMQSARREGLAFGEVGGWAIAAERRCTTDALRIILATYALLELLGGSKGVATATCRHCSAPVLRRIGLSSLVAGDCELPAYYDPQYRCDMEVLRFDSRFPNPKYLAWVMELSAHLSTVPVIGARSRPYQPALQPMDASFLQPAFLTSRAGYLA
jgi:hypothetical protein